MGAFELDRTRGREQRRDGIEELAESGCEPSPLIDRRRLKEECIIALKVYDHCRQPDCNNTVFACQ